MKKYIIRATQINGNNTKTYLYFGKNYWGDWSLHYNAHEAEFFPTPEKANSMLKLSDIYKEFKNKLSFVMIEMKPAL